MIRLCYVSEKLDLAMKLSVCAVGFSGDKLSAVAAQDNGPLKIIGLLKSFNSANCSL